MELHRNDNMRMMQENVTLAKENNDLRREIKQMKMAQRAQAMGGSSTTGFGGNGGAGGGGGGGGASSAETARLRQRIDELEAGAMVANRPTSRERLPQMEGVTPAQ